MYKTLSERQLETIELFMIPSMGAVLNHKNFGKGVGTVARFLANFRIPGGYWLAQDKSHGARTDLISKRALELNPKCNVKATGCTWDHVNGVRDTSKEVFLKFQELNSDVDKFLQWINDNWEDMTTSIQITTDENNKLTKFSKKMTYEQKLNMEHYKALGIKLHRVDKRSHLFTDYSDSVKSLIEGVI